MKICGITHPISYNTASALTEDSSLKFFMEEERFNRIKQSPNTYPIAGISFIKNNYFLERDQAELAVGFRFGKSHKDFLDIQQMLSDGELNKAFSTYFKLKENTYSLDAIFHDFNKWSKINFYDHHLCHAYSVISLNKFLPGIVLSIDGWGGESSGVVARWNGSELKELLRIPHDYSLGLFYEKFTEFCGLRRHHSEGSLMGMAALAKGKFVNIPELIFDGPCNLPNRFKLDDWMDKLNKPKTEAEKSILANTAQVYLEKMIQDLVESFILDEDDSIMLAGGVALNCTSNGSLSRKYSNKRIVVQPASHDGGTAFGAAVIANLEKGQRIIFDCPYLGRDISTTLFEFKPHYINRIPFDKEFVANNLKAGKVFAVCFGKDEVGPRALCNRSIIASPYYKNNKEKLNRIKRRQWWRPLAPVTNSNLIQEVVNSVPNADLRFMNVACFASELLMSVGSACVHLDGTIRPQILENSHPLKEIVDIHFSITGCPALINTSFNVGNEPMVSSFEDALRTFLISPEIDCLVVDDAIYIK